MKNTSFSIVDFKIHNITKILIFFIVLFCLQLKYNKAFAQTILKNTRNIGVEVSDIYETDNQLIYFYSKREGLNKIKQGYLKGRNTAKFTTGVLINDTDIVLEDGEAPVLYQDNIIFTKKICWSDYQIEINSYKLKNNKLHVLNQLIIDGIEKSIEIEKKSGFISVSDLSEGYGTYLRVYDSNFNELIDFRPYSKSYEDIRYDIHNNLLIVLCTKLRKENKSKLMLVDMNTKKIRFEKLFNRYIEGAYLKGYDNKIIISGFDGRENLLMCYNFSGDMLWNTKKTLSHYFVLPIYQNNTMFASNKNILYAIDLITGKEIWQFILNNDNTNNIIMSYILLDNDIAILGGNYVLPSREKGGEFPFFNNVDLLKIDMSGKENQTISVGNNIKHYNLQSYNGNIYLITDKT